MPDVLVIEFQANTDALKQIPPAIDKITEANQEQGAEFKKNSATMIGGTEELRKKLQQLQKEEAALIALQKQSNQPGIIKQLDDQLIKVRADMAAVNKEALNLNGSVGKLSGSFNRLGSVIHFGAAKKQVEEFGKSINEAATKGIKLTTQLRTMRDELAKMEQAGLRGSKAFLDMSIKAARLEDQIGDTNRQIRVLASDTRALDFVTSTVTAMAGAFSIAQGAAALLGDENEDLQKALLKVQAAMAILNGLQAVSTALKKDEVIATNLAAVAHRAWAIVIGTSTGALKVFRIALASTGIGLIILAIGGLVANFDKIKAKVNEITPFFSRLGDFVKDVIGVIGGLGNVLFEVIGGVGQAIKSLFERDLGGMKDAIRSIDIQGAFREGFDNTIKVIESFGGKTEDALQDHVDRLGDIMKQQIEDMRDQDEALRQAIDQVTQSIIAPLTTITASIAEGLPEPEDDPLVVHYREVNSQIQAMIEATKKINEDNIIEGIEDILKTAAILYNSLSGLEQAYTNFKLAQLDEQFQAGKISEERYQELLKKEKTKQAQRDKAFNLFQAAIDIPSAILQAFSQGGIALAILVGALAAIQLGFILATPIPKFAKGTESVKGGQAGKDSVMAMLMPGERIVPTDVNRELSGIPNQELPKLAKLKTIMDEMPGLNFEALEKIKESGSGRFNFDYQLMATEFGKELKKYPQHFWTVDRHGIGLSVQENGNWTTYIDDRYSA